MFALDACSQVSDNIQLIMNMLHKALFHSPLHCWIRMNDLVWSVMCSDAHCMILHDFAGEHDDHRRWHGIHLFEDQGHPNVSCFSTKCCDSDEWRYFIPDSKLSLWCYYTYYMSVICRMTCPLASPSTIRRVPRGSRTFWSRCTVCCLHISHEEAWTYTQRT